MPATGINTVGYTFGSGWINQGGSFTSGLAVAASNGVTHLLGVASNGYLYHRTQATGWHRLVPDTFTCKYVAAITDAEGTVHVGCTGLNNALYTFTFDGTQTLPFVPGGWVKAPGMVVSGPITASYGYGKVYFETTGPEYVQDGVTHNQWYWDGDKWLHRIYCSTAYSWALDPSTAEGTYVCGITRADGTKRIRIAHSGTDYVDVSGATNHVPALVVIDEVTMRIFVQGTNGRLYSQDIVEGQPTGTWTNHGGTVQYGVTAVRSGGRWSRWSPTTPVQR